MIIEYDNCELLIFYFHFYIFPSGLHISSASCSNMHKTDAIDEQLWSRWASGARAMKSIPTFQAVWNKTKNVHTRDFVNFIDSL
jgi:hypothetical protein